jgi:uncharacterized protein with HEPN domain
VSERDERLYLADILEAIDRINLYVAEGRDAFLSDRKTQDAVVRNLEVIGEAAKNVTAATQAAHPEVPWRQIASTRNRVIHGYFSVDLDIVWNVVAVDLPPLRAQIAALIRNA